MRGAAEGSLRLIVAFEIQDLKTPPPPTSSKSAVAFNLGSIVRLGSLPQTLNETLTRNALPWWRNARPCTRARIYLAVEMLWLFVSLL